MARHPTLYFEDGFLTLKAGDGSGTLYNVYRAPLMRQSDVFKGMLSLPNPALPPLKLTDNSREYLAKAKEQGLEATSDETAIILPAQFSGMEIEKFLEFIFLQGWSSDDPDLETACALLKLSHFFAVDAGFKFARRHLDNREELGPVLRLKMGFDYQIKAWIAKGFDELMAVPITEITLEEEALMGWAAYRALARAQAEVLDYRLTLALKPPTPNHCNWCSNHTCCANEWEKMWMSPSGVLGALIKDELAGSEILDNLNTYPVGTMNVECHRRTCEGLEGTTESPSILKGEETLIDNAITQLMKQYGITGGDS
ncbi:hypothetical protein B0H19DRAFT_1245294 [Mycena capillaripes]|nr:hypothetical protein B0H19DRAFT_1245294 [Mycena capillaripes]